ncbi:SMI1/KNR4 family protein [Anoxybacteroides amylolyticum]|uniref:SMI1 / KNR4 family protein n=1 Tax=Anoxybacteroides amylolyticum TaxID=294699 RepID=A0A167TBP9_9BACL|nr:SMI1/KNR4 family protein [Anoxybacillus amylolyticus]ANB59920.1 SMI1 / KNR4 family protein [Anoxybacillus amylolyticus]
MDFIGYGKATVQMIDEFEQYIGFSLPEDYRHFLLQYNGGKPRERYYSFFVEELNESIPLNVLYGLDTDIEQVNLKVWHDEYRDDLIENCIIIGSDPGSGMIVLVNDNEERGVYYWDHSWHFDQSNEENNLYKISDSFQNFFDGLKKL